VAAGNLERTGADVVGTGVEIAVWQSSHKVIHPQGMVQRPRGELQGVQ